MRPPRWVSNLKKSEEDQCTSGGGMLLLLAIVDTYTIYMVVKWQIEIMLHYPHTPEQKFVAGLVLHMVQHGDYALIPPSHEG